ncbi:MAG TPA: TIGR03915 family putative DNA repair protein, partial [Candidatus Hydrogenedentes bacterium]|nr:TIGR03915 family putative DNA repair protein [Candidatus Hydrogenedentota bacterium]
TLLEPAGGRKLVYDLLCVFLSEAPDRETLMFQMVQVSVALGQRGRRWHSRPDMRRAGMLIDRVRREAHRSKGLLRFVELRDGTLYARYAPSHDVTPLVAGHFRRRMPRQRWAIHDEVRHYGVVWDGAAFHEAEGFPQDMAESLTESESRYQACWRAFFRELEIPERRNLRLQRHFLPERFRKYLPELD